MSAAPSAFVPAVLAWEDLLERAGGDEELAREVLAEVLALLRDDERVLAGVPREDEAALARAAHRIRGALATSGLLRAAAAAATVEALASSERTDCAAALLVLREELATARAAVERCLAMPSPR